MPRTKKSNKQKYTYSVGRRKEASARVRLLKGSGDILVNDQPIEKYFPGNLHNDAWVKPFRVADAVDKYHATIRVVGGGVKGQLGAVVHGISRALAKENKEKFRKPLKKAGFLTRDARVKERRKVGTGGKARRKKQSPKR